MEFNKCISICGGPDYPVAKSVAAGTFPVLFLAI